MGIEVLDCFMTTLMHGVSFILKSYTYQSMSYYSY